MSLKYLSNFWRSLELPLINCKTELKLLSAAGNDNINANLKITFTTKDKKTYIIVVTSSAKDYQSKGFERPVYWNEYETTRENKNTTSKYRYFLKWNFVGVNRLFALVIQIKTAILKDLKLEDFVYQKGKWKIIMWSSMEKTFMINQSVLKSNNMKKLEN